MSLPDLSGLHVIITGNPVDGLRIIGPFKTGEDAVDWADRKGQLEADWWIAKLEAQASWESDDEAA